MLKPLSQFVCDTCRQLIEKPEDGWFEWLEGDDGKAHSFRIVHNGPSSPRKERGCNYRHDTADLMDGDLTDFIGPNVAALYRFLDAGPYHDPKAKYLSAVRDLREYTEILRRLTLPYYEEARLSWSAAKNDGYFDGANEVWLYMPDTLKTLINRYGGH